LCDVLRGSAMTFSPERAIPPSTPFGPDQPFRRPPDLVRGLHDKFGQMFEDIFFVSFFVREIGRHVVRIGFLVGDSIYHARHE